MKEINDSDTKKGFSELVRHKVQHTGQPAHVTRRAGQMVEIIPVAAPTGRRTKTDAIAALEVLRHELHKSPTVKIRADIAQGRH